MDESTRSMLWNHKPPAATPRAADTLFEFVRASDQRAMAWAWQERKAMEG
jgi:hypothetical protein